MPIDDSPRRIWLGVTIPGKKMVRAMGATGLDAGRELNYLYEEPIYTVLLMVAHALHGAPQQGAVGPALRDLRDASAGPGRMLYGAVFTDIRDFLKLRFRAPGLDTVLAAGDLTSGAWPTTTDPGGVVNFMISALDSLTRIELPGTQFSEVLNRLRDLSRETAKQADPRVRSADIVGQMSAKMYDEPWT